MDPSSDPYSHVLFYNFLLTPLGIKRGSWPFCLHCIAVSVVSPLLRVFFLFHIHYIIYWRIFQWAISILSQALVIINVLSAISHPPHICIHVFLLVFSLKTFTVFYVFSIIVLLNLMGSWTMIRKQNM